MWLSMAFALVAVGSAQAFVQPVSQALNHGTVARSLQHTHNESGRSGSEFRLYTASDPGRISPEDSDNNSDSVARTDEMRESRTDANAADSSIDWDNAWAAKKADYQKAAAVREATKVARPAFSKRSEVIVTGNEQDGFEFVEIAADGSRPNDGGFKLDDQDTRGGQARKDIMARELQLVDSVSFDKVFQVGGLVLAVLLGLMINVYNSGGITNEATRFQGIQMPMYEDRPISIPHPSNQIYHSNQDTNSDLVI